jgi:hypothetical protein
LEEDQLPKKLLLLAACSLLVGAFAFACDDDDDTSVIDEVATEIGDAATSITGEITEITEDETPEAGGNEATRSPDDCPTVEADDTPDPDATIPAGCPTPSRTAIP